MTRSTSPNFLVRVASQIGASARASGASLALGLAALLSASACTTEVVNHVVAAPEQKGIAVTGSGKILSAPDIAVINIGVESWGDEPKIAVDENTKQTTALVETLKKLGIADADLRTSNFSIRFERREQPPVWTAPQNTPAVALQKATPNTKAATPTVEAAPPPPAPKREGSFIVNNTLNVTVRDLSKLGTALSSATDAGANTIWGVDFRIENPEPLMAQARDKAVADAIAKAKRLAEVSGTKLGALVSVEESGRALPAPANGIFYAKAASVPVEAGTLEVVADVTVRFALD